MTQPLASGDGVVSERAAYGAKLDELPFMRTGSLAVWWNQTEYVVPRTEHGPVEAPRQKFAQRVRNRIFDWKPWRIDVRLVPPEGYPLAEFMEDCVEAFGIEPVNGAGEEHRSVVLWGCGYYFTARDAISATLDMLAERAGIMQVDSLQIRVSTDLGPPPTEGDGE